MIESELKDDVNSLKKRLDKLEKKGKDIWDKTSILSSFLIPLSIFFAGYFLSKADRIATIESQKKEIQLAEIKSKVDQAQLVASFLEALVDTNSYKRKLAIKSILLALPEKGGEIVEEISASDPDETVKAFAKKSLIDSKTIKRTELIKDIFSSTKNIRISATESLMKDWRSDELLIPELLDFAMNRFGQEKENMNGILNTILVLNRMDIDILKKNKVIVNQFIAKVELLENRDLTQKYLEKLKNRMNYK